EAGAGFAVVADEVQNLARQAAEAAKTTEGLINKSNNQIRDTTVLNQQVSQAMEENAGIAKKVKELIAEIAAASAKQTRRIDRINTAAAQVDKVTKQNARTAEESAAAAHEMSAQVEQMRSSVAILLALIEGVGDDAGKKVNFAVRPALERVLKKELKTAAPKTGTRSFFG
ncbi:MAG: methyl-accepting chemotaxis protein, partial [Desulfobacterales bacterium]